MRLRAWVAGHHGASVVAATVVVSAALTGTILTVLASRRPVVVIGTPRSAATRQAVESPGAGEGGRAAGAGGPGPTNGRSGGSRSGDAGDDGPGGSGGPGSASSGSGRLLEADGHPFQPAIPFDAAIPVPDHLIWVLLVGSDARPGEDVARSRADSIHLVGANPRSHQATVLGIPRDSWVPIPGHGVGKINSALALGGPDLLADTVHQVTGLPVQLYLVTSFDGLAGIVDELGGVDVHVDDTVADPASGSFLAAGWHHLTGAQALAFSRARKTLPNGDFDRSLHQGQVLLGLLAKLRAEVGDLRGIERWIGVTLRHVTVSHPADTLESLAAAARLTDVTQVRNVVAPGHAGWAGPQSVVYLEAGPFAALLDDLRPDAVIGTPAPPTTQSTSTSTSTSTATSTTAATVGSSTTSTAAG